MNLKQKLAMIVVVITLGMMLLFPPVEQRSKNYLCPDYHPIWGWGFIKSSQLGQYRFQQSCSVNFPLLLTQWLGLIVIGGVAFYMLRDKK